MKNRALLPATQEIRDVCSLLTKEMLRWPGVKMYHLFGTCAFYHRKVMFAMLPDKRSLDSASAISFKTCTASQSEENESWDTFEVTSRAMVSVALESLEKAYESSKLTSASPAVMVGY